MQFVAITRERKRKEREREQERETLVFLELCVCRLVLFFVVKKERHDDERTH